MKVINLNCQSIVGTKTYLFTMCETPGRDIVIRTDPWLTDQHHSSEIFPDDYKVFRRDRKKRMGGGVFILVWSCFHSLEPELSELTAIVK